MKNPLRVIQALHSFVTLVRDPDKLGKVFELRNAISDRQMMAKMVGFFEKEPTGAAAFRDLPRVGKIDLYELRRLPEGTLGRTFAEHMIANELDPASMPSMSADNPVDYVTAHLYETHDLWHVATGFSTDVAGELGLQAFYLAQFPAPLALAILAGGMLNTMIFRLDDRDARMDEIARGWAMGKACKPFFGVRWADLWATPLDEVRRQLEIPVSSRASHIAAPARSATPARSSTASHDAIAA